MKILEILGLRPQIEQAKATLLPSRLERFSPRNLLRTIREYIPLPPLMGVAGAVSLAIIGPRILGFHGNALIYPFVGFMAGFIAGIEVYSYAGAEEWKPKS